jgi:DNA polymerase-4
MRSILHVDMDAFYASVEERDRPELRGRPLIVGGTSGRGVVAAANYVVRRFGVHSAMPIREALRRCPEAICVPPRMARYGEVSAQVFEVFRRFTPIVEGLSLDEAYLDVTASERLFGGPVAIAESIRRRIRAETELTASVGIAPNKLLAKIASDLDKPDGLFRIGPENLNTVLDPLPIEKLRGVGRQTLPRVKAAGIHSFGDLQRASEAVLWRAFGAHGHAMQALARGIDERPVAAQRAEQSISSEETFATDHTDAPTLERALLQLADRTAARLRAHELAAGCVQVKIRRADFQTYTRQRVLAPASADTRPIGALAQRLLAEWLRRNPGCAVRLLGVGVTDLVPQTQGDLFTVEPPRETRLDAAVDEIRDRFGAGTVTRASLLPRADGKAEVSS